MTGSGGSLEVRRRRPLLLHFGGRWVRMSGGGGEGRENYAGRRSQSGRKGSGGGEEWGCAGGVEEKVTCGDKGWLFHCRRQVQFTD